jgi:hypothetical protein
LEGDGVCISCWSTCYEVAAKIEEAEQWSAGKQRSEEMATDTADASPTTPIPAAILGWINYFDTIH